jgi:hypothetical protein
MFLKSFFYGNFLNKMVTIRHKITKRHSFEVIFFILLREINK